MSVSPPENRANHARHPTVSDDWENLDTSGSDHRKDNGWQTRWPSIGRVRSRHTEWVALSTPEDVRVLDFAGRVFPGALSMRIAPLRKVLLLRGFRVNR